MIEYGGMSQNGSYNHSRHGQSGRELLLTKKRLSYNHRLTPSLGKQRRCLKLNLLLERVDTGEIPKEWSLANICPQCKKGDRSLTCNYRTVSLNYVPCKLLEHIVCSNIMAHLGEHKLLSDRQHALRKKHSCETQLITVIDDWAKILDKGGQVDGFILDFEKAFDTPPHELLNCKLYGYGIGEKTEMDRFFSL